MLTSICVKIGTPWIYSPVCPCVLLASCLILRDDKFTLSAFYSFAVYLALFSLFCYFFSGFSCMSCALSPLSCPLSISIFIPFIILHNYRIFVSPFQINRSTRCNNFSSLLLDIYVQLNIFRASSRPSSGAQQLQ